MVKPTTQAPLGERVGGDEGRERSVPIVGGRAELGGGEAEGGAGGVCVHLGVVCEVDVLANVVPLEARSGYVC